MKYTQTRNDCGTSRVSASQGRPRRAHPTTQVIRLLFLGVVAMASVHSKAAAQELQSLDCDTESTLKSLNSNTPTSVEFVNETADGVEVYWLDFSGNRVHYATLAADKSYVQPTYLTHPWVVTNSAGKCLAVFQPVAAREIARLCVIPDGETSKPIDWEKGGIYDWRQTLTPLTTNFKGKTVTEQDPGGGVDTCWFPGDKYEPYVKVDGDDWKVKKDNVWGDDAVGFYGKVVTYYRNKGRAPCHWRLDQRMVINCGTTKRAYIKNSLSGGITPTEVSSERAGQAKTRIWP